MRENYLYGTIVKVLLCLAVALVPLFYLPWTSNVLEYNKQMVLVVAMLIGLIAWLLGAVISGTLIIRTSPIDKGVFAVLAASLAATIFSLTPMSSLFGTGAGLSTAFLTIATMSIFYFLTVNTMHDHGRMLRLILVLSTAAALAISILQAFKLFVLPGAFTHVQSFNTVGSLGAIGVLAGVMLPLFVKMGFRTGSRFIAFFSNIGVALAVVMLAVLNTWVLWAIALVGMLAMIAFDSFNITRLAEDYSGKKNRFALSRFVVPMIIIVVGGFFLLVNINFTSMKAAIPAEKAPSFALSWRVATSVLKYRPITGMGPENFSLAFDKFGADQLANTRIADIRYGTAASEVFNLAVHGGAIMIFAMLCLFGCIVQVIVRFGGAISASIARGESAILAAQSSGVLASVVAVVVALFLCPFNLTLWFVSFVLLALAALILSGDHLQAIDLEERPSYSLSASLGFIVGLILVLSGFYLASVRYLGDVRYARAQTEGVSETALRDMDSAIGFNSSNDRYLRDGSQLSIAMLRLELAKPSTDTQRAQRAQGMVSSAIQLAQRAIEANPNDSLNPDNLGRVYQSLLGVVGDVEQLSEDAYAKASQLRPGDPTFDNEIGQMWLTKSDIAKSLLRQSGADTGSIQKQVDQSLAKAETAFLRAINRAPSYGLAIYNLGTVYERQGKIDDAIRQLEKIAPYNTNQPTVMFELGLLYVRAGRKDDALKEFQQAVFLAPQFSNARWYLSLLLEEKGDIDGALVQLYEIQKSNQDNIELQQKIIQLEAGKRAIPPGKVIDSKPLQ